ncbi:hypothetical protein OG336_00090 [[Kitasatospora] papulosa]|uniref:hypothetical protein n=1 Tax=[Kitasatospora] papulosa TaxID=1464011 RepID=UPI002E160842|nr:hypothetical protein OG336_00090 [[Kitasatospora] papulosa]
MEIVMPEPAVVVFTAALVVILALLTAGGASKLARLDGSTYPAALMRGPPLSPLCSPLPPL